LKTNVGVKHELGFIRGKVL